MKQKIIIFAGFISLVCLAIPIAGQADPFDIREKTGVIESIRFSDPLKESNILGEADVVDGLGKRITIEITLDTSIRDPDWHLAYVAYLTKGDKIKVRYKVTREGVNLAQDIHMIKE